MGSKRSDLPMQIKTLDREDMVSAGLDVVVREVADTMFDRSVGSVVIVENDEPASIVTDRDLPVELAAGGGDVTISKTERDLADVRTDDTDALLRGIQRDVPEYTSAEYWRDHPEHPLLEMTLGLLRAFATELERLEQRNDTDTESDSVPLLAVDQLVRYQRRAAHRGTFPNARHRRG